MDFWSAATSLPGLTMVFFFLALLLAFAFEFINGFHDTANAVTTVIYTRSLKPTPAVIYSGFLNFLGVLFGGVGVAYGIVKLFPQEVVFDPNSKLVLVMVVAMLISAVSWNLGTWYFGLPVSSSHTLIGSIIGVALAYSLLSGKGFNAVPWAEASKVGLGLLFSPLIGFGAAFVLLLLLKSIIKTPRLYEPPVGDDRPPNWIRNILIFTCGAVSFTHGSNDGQKGMGLIMLILIGFLGGFYALNIDDPSSIEETKSALVAMGEKLEVDYSKYTEKSGDPILLEKLARIVGDKKILTHIAEDKPFELSEEETIEARKHVKERHDKFVKDRIEILAKLDELKSFNEVPLEERLKLRERITKQGDIAKNGGYKIPGTTFFGLIASETKLEDKIRKSTEWAPFWVIVGVALCLGLGTCIGYKRIVVTVAEKIGKTHLTYAQGMCAELVAAITIYLASYFKVPVSTTHILNSAVAGTMVANKSGLQRKTVTKILLTWVFTLPSTMLLGGLLYWIGKMFV
jgi:PiT family inorganic phosphate transporter